MLDNHISVVLSEPQINPKCCQSPILAIIMKIPKMAKIIYRQMLARRELPQQISVPVQKLGCKALGGGKFLVQIPRGVRGGWLWMKLIPALQDPIQILYFVGSYTGSWQEPSRIT